jgi:hypothetical protein
MPCFAPIPRRSCRVPGYPRLAVRSVMVLVGMGAAASCGGSDGGYAHGPSGSQFVADDAGDAKAGSSGAGGSNATAGGGNAANGGSAGEAGAGGANGGDGG